MTHFSIKDLAEFSGIKPHTIRIWEQRYSFLNPLRSPTARRTYSVEELNILLDVALLNQNGHKISHIDLMTMEEKLLLVSNITDQQQKAIHDLIINMANMCADGFEMALRKSVRYWGIHTTIQQILLPFCDMVGLLQNNISRNYAENIIVILPSIKQQLYVGIENTPAVTSETNKILLFQPFGEPEELSLLFLQYLIKLNGMGSLHLGAVHTNHLNVICSYKKPSYIITHINKRSNLTKKVEEILKGLSMEPYATFISIENDLTAPKHMKYKKISSLLEVVEFINTDRSA